MMMMMAQIIFNFTQLIQIYMAVGKICSRYLFWNELNRIFISFVRRRHFMMKIFKEQTSNAQASFRTPIDIDKGLAFTSSSSVAHSATLTKHTIYSFFRTQMTTTTTIVCQSLSHAVSITCTFSITNASNDQFFSFLFILFLFVRLHRPNAISSHVALIFLFCFVQNAPTHKNRPENMPNQNNSENIIYCDVL